MTTDRPGTGHEQTAAVDRPFDDDRPSGQDLTRTDAACSFVWQADGFEAVSVFLDPVLLDRTPGICQTMDALCGQHRDLDAFSDAVMRFAAGEGLSAAIHERPRDSLSRGIVAVAFTVG